VPADAVVPSRLVERFGTPVALLVLALGFALARPDAFATTANLLNVTQQMAILAIIATAATFVMVIGEFDLSVGFVASFAGVLVVKLLAAGTGTAPSVLLTLLACAGFGAVNGLIVHGLRAPSFIATLALGTIVSGLAYWLSGGASLFQGIPADFTILARAMAGPLPVLTLWMLAVLLAGGFVLACTVFGRRLIAMGSNREAARLAGVPIGRPIVTVFALAAALSGLAGVLLAARLGSVQHTMGEGFPLPAYAAVFLGTTAFRGGRPNLLGTAVGVAIIAVLANGLTILNVEPFFQKMVTGAIIIAAVMLRRFGMAAAR
jgi:ribose transport system permease protein